MIPAEASAGPGARLHPWALGGALVLAAALRLVSLGVTEVEWWDSTVYLTEARRIAEAIPWAPPYETHRAPLLPWLGALSFSAGLGARGIYLANVLLSVGTVGLTYAAGALLFGRAAGLASAVLMAVSWESLFFTQRVLTETPALFFWLLALVAWLLAVVRGRTTWFLLLGPAVALAFLSHFRAGAILLAFALHFVAAGKWGLLRRREVLASAALALLGFGAYAAFSAARWGSPFGFLRSYQLARLRSLGPERLVVFARYLGYLPSYLGSFLFALLLGALAVGLARALRRAGQSSAPEAAPERAGVLLAGLVLVPLALPSLFESFHHRLGVLCLPGLFLLLGAAIAGAAERIAPRSAAVARAAFAGALAIAAAQQLGTADDWLHAEGSSYLSVKDAALWVGRRSPAGAAVVTTSWPQVNYYAERPTAGVPGTAAGFEALVRERRAPFLVLSDYERTPPWVAPFLEENAARLPLVFSAGDVPGLQTRGYDLSALVDGPGGGELGAVGPRRDRPRPLAVGVAVGAS